MKTLRLAWLFPDNLNLHGERGNILALQRICNRHEIDLQIDKIHLDSAFQPQSYDMIIMLSGELSQFPTIIETLRPYRASLKEYLEKGKPLLVTGTSVALWGNHIFRENGKNIQGMGILPLKVKENTVVYGDDLYYQATYNNRSFEVIGNQIQMADFHYEDNDHHYGILTYGYGNNGDDCYEGYCLHNGIFTNTLGPLFILNPWICIEFINLALINRNEVAIQDSSFQIEEKSFEEKKKYIMGKKTNLRPCKGVTQ